jgi:hypothetical protein
VVVGTLALGFLPRSRVTASYEERQSDDSLHPDAESITCKFSESWSQVPQVPLACSWSREARHSSMNVDDLTIQIGLAPQAMLVYARCMLSTRSSARRPQHDR